jgi:hypothetical protein
MPLETLGLGPHPSGHQDLGVDRIRSVKFAPHRDNYLLDAKPSDAHLHMKSKFTYP